MTSADVPVVVVGGGPGGLTLARVLQLGGVPVTVLERDPSPATRVRGGPLDLHADSGQIAIRAAGLYGGWRALARSEDEQMTLLDHHGTVLATFPPSPDGEGNPEIDRSQLRDLLLDALEPGAVRWGTTITEVVARDDGRHEVRWHGGAISADLVVGADGAWSRVRPLLSSSTPAYSGVTFVEFTVPSADAHRADVAALFGPGTTIAQGPFRGLGGQRLSDGSLWCHVALRVPEEWGDDVPHDDAAAHAFLRGHLDGWSSRVLGVLDAGEGPFTVRRIRALPVDHEWSTVPGLTLVGDAAHVMSPFGGNGANVAMLDAVDLGASIVRASAGTATGRGATIGGVVGRYEMGMYPRAHRAAVEARAGIDGSFTAAGPAHSLAVLNDMIGAPSG